MQAVYGVPVPPPGKKPTDTITIHPLRVLAGAAGGTLAIALLDGMGAPEGLLTGTLMAFRQQIFATGGPLALGIVAAGFFGGTSEMQAACASAMAQAGLIATGVIPMTVDVPLLTTVAAGAVGIYAGQMVLLQL